MTPPADPYRVLGLPPGAPLDDVKRAYRRLAKASHPDSAGPTATARFIALQQAYEALLLIAPTARRAAAGRSSRRPAPGARPRPRTASGTGPGAPGGTAGGASTGTPRSAREGTSPPKGTRTDAGDEPGARRRSARRATLGTTSYDDAEPGRPTDWQGASWYGVSTGTYWTINPKEYADPRKHGPEYLARGRRHEPGDARPGDAGPGDGGPGDGGPGDGGTGDAADGASAAVRPGAANPPTAPASAPRASFGSDPRAVPPHPRSGGILRRMIERARGGR